MRLTADPVRRITLVPALLGALLAASAAGAQPATLLRSSLPGAFGVRISPTAPWSAILSPRPVSGRGRELSPAGAPAGADPLGLSRW